jgi:hypothetical protein
MNIIKTNLTVLDINPFQMFLAHHRITGVFVGIHSKRVNAHQTDNFIQYVYDNDNESTPTITALSLQYGSLEKAFETVRYFGK